MGLFGSLFELVTDVVKLPLAIVADTVTLGEAGATSETLKDIVEDVVGNKK